MKIGIVLYPTFGGSGVVATELGKALAVKGHQIHFITYSQPVRLGSFRENIYYHEVAVSDYPLFEYQPYETELASKMMVFDRRITIHTFAECERVRTDADAGNFLIQTIQWQGLILIFNNHHCFFVDPGAR